MAKYEQYHLVDDFKSDSRPNKYLAGFLSEDPKGGTTVKLHFTRFWQKAIFLKDLRKCSMPNTSIVFGRRVQTVQSDGKKALTEAEKYLWLMEGFCNDLTIIFGK